MEHRAIFEAACDIYDVVGDLLQGCDRFHDRCDLLDRHNMQYSSTQRNQIDSEGWDLFPASLRRAFFATKQSRAAMNRQTVLDCFAFARNDGY